MKMNPIPNIVVIDFCEWLMERMTNDDVNQISPLDLMIDSDNFEILDTYSEQFLQQRQNSATSCQIRSIIYQFLSSQEFEHALKKCQKRCPLIRSKSYNEDVYWEDCFHYCMFNGILYDAFRKFTRNYNNTNYYDIYNITHYKLTRYMQNLIHIDDDVKNSSPFMQLMVSSRISIADEIEFFEWLQTNKNDPTSIRKMPSTVFEKLVDEYITFSRKGENTKKQLLKAYRQTGWENLIKKIQALFKFNKTKYAKEIDQVIDRYYSRYGKYNCIILPLCDSKSQKQYQTLITDSWHDLNELSADTLDIYYSESDNGKSGFDIAKRISSLPEYSKNDAPCLVLWKYSIKDAQAIPIDELTNMQILSVIKTVVQSIQKKDDLDAVIKEAHKFVKEQQRINKGTTIINVAGNENVIGDNNIVETIITNGDNNKISHYGNHSYSQDLINEFNQTIKVITESIELDNEQKKQMLEIMQQAKTGIIENSTEKSESAKKAFSYVKGFLVKVAPTLISVLANYTQIASYFGI